jgi:hypothetical protein
MFAIVRSSILAVAHLNLSKVTGLWMPIDWRKSQPTPVQFLSKFVGILLRVIANEAIPTAGIPVGVYLTANTFVKVQKRLVFRI